MKIITNKSLFWFLREEVELDMERPEHIDLYVQQVLSYGHTSDIQRLFSIIPRDSFLKSFSRIKKFLPLQVRKFWEE